MLKREADEDDAFFRDSYKYDTNFHTSPTLDQTAQTMLDAGMYMDLTTGINDNGSVVSTLSSKLSRVARSDPILENECFEGFLDKKSPKLLVGWQVLQSLFNFYQTRYFVLKNRKLQYYKKKEVQDKPKGIINFDLVDCTLLHQGQKQRFQYLSLLSSYFA